MVLDLAARCELGQLALQKLGIDCQTRTLKSPVAQPMQSDVAQTFLSAGSRDFPVPCFHSGTGDWKVARTRRLESLRYRRNLIRLQFSS